MSFFEEVAKFRAGRRIWAQLTRERFGAKDEKSWRFKFHGQTSGVDLTREQPLNNIARVTVQAMAGILGGLQSLHTDSFDEVMSVPTERAARIAVSTQNILKEEAHLTDVADALGGSYYVEALTDAMEAKIREVIARIDAAGGMYAAVEAGLPQRICGDLALAFQGKVDRGEETIVGVNKYRVPEAEEMAREALKPPPKKKVEAQLKRIARFKAKRSGAEVQRALHALARAAESKDENVYEKVVDAACAGVTHGEICAGLRKVYGFGAPLHRAVGGSSEALTQRLLRAEIAMVLGRRRLGPEK